MSRARARPRSPVAHRAALLVLLALPGCATAQSSARRAPASMVDIAGLRLTLDSIADRHHGVVGYAVRDIDGTARIERRGDETFPTASLIKVAVLVTLFDEIGKGRLTLDDPLVVTRADQVPGSGLFSNLHSGAAVTVGDAAWFMITVSDNTATNLLLDRLEIGTVWAKMDSLGLHHTKIHHKVFKGAISSLAPDSSAKYGLGVTTPNEMASLFAMLGAGKAVSSRADSTMLYILEHNTDDGLMMRYLEGVRAAHKSGAVDASRTECALFYLRTRVVACVLTRENADQRWLIDNEANVTLAKMGKAIAEAFTR